MDEATIRQVARECAAAAADEGAPRRALRGQEDAGPGDYAALSDALDLTRPLTSDERHVFRAAYSATLASMAD